MSHYYGTIKGQAGQATRRGSKNSGLTTEAASWAGCVRVSLWHSSITGKDHYEVTLSPWQGNGGPTRLIAEGSIQGN